MNQASLPDRLVDEIETIDEIASQHNAVNELAMRMMRTAFAAASGLGPAFYCNYYQDFTGKMILEIRADTLSFEGFFHFHLGIIALKYELEWKDDKPTATIVQNEGYGKVVEGITTEMSTPKNNLLTQADRIALDMINTARQYQRFGDSHFSFTYCPHRRKKGDDNVICGSGNLSWSVMVLDIKEGDDISYSACRYHFIKAGCSLDIKSHNHPYFEGLNTLLMRALEKK